MNIKQLLKEEIDNILNRNKEEVVTFTNNPLEYILQKYPSLEATLVDLMTGSFKDYLTGIYVMAPKPTTFKILLHNGQSFYLIYTPKAYIAKISGKKYHLMNLNEEEYAIKAIAALLVKGMPPGAEGPEEVVDDKKPKSKSKSSSSSSTAQSDAVSDNEVESEDEAPAEDDNGEDDKDELKEDNEIKPVPKKFRIVR